MRRAYHIARADFLQRVRSRRLVVVLAIVAYFGYLVNVGGIELAYQVETGDTAVNVHGIETAAFVGLKAGLTGTTVLVLGGFYMMNATIRRDRASGVDRLVASTSVTDWTYLFGKWLSNVGLGAVLLTALGVATVVNHLVHGVGPTRPLVLLGPLVVFGLPAAAVVGAVGVFFESVEWLDGTGGNIAYFLLASVVIAGLAAAEGKLPSAVPTWVKAIDLLGQLAAYELTIDALHTTVPSYRGGPPSFGTLDATQTFAYHGRAWPSWIFAQRLWLLLPALAILTAATVPFDRLRSTDTAERTAWATRMYRWLPRLGGDESAAETVADPPPLESLTLTPVEDRDAGGFHRLVVAEFRLAVRGRRWWWYAGVAALVGAPIAALLPLGLEIPTVAVRKLLLPLAFIWPIFVWSEMGVRSVRHQVTDLLFSSNYPLLQLFAQWVAGVGVALGVSSGVLVFLVSAGEPGVLLGVVSGVLFAPSLAIAVGIWSRSSSVFELLYLLLWYAGPLNGGVGVDFVGSTPASVAQGVPLVFVGVSAVLVGAAALRRGLDLR